MITSFSESLIQTGKGLGRLETGEGNRVVEGEAEREGGKRNGVVERRRKGGRKKGWVAGGWGKCTPVIIIPHL
jgi:hypothetical protein